MSLMGTLAKVAIGIAVAKGVGSLVQGGGRGGSTPPSGSGGGLEDMMGDILGGRKSAPSGGGIFGNAPSGQGTGNRTGSGSQGGLGGLLEELGRFGPGGGTAAGRAGAPAPQGSGLDDLLGSLTGGSGGGGLGDLLGGLTGGRSAGSSAGGGGLGDLLGGLVGGLAGGAAGGRGGSFGDILNQSLGNRGEPDVAPSPEQNAAAALMLRAMVQAAKSDGKIDAREQEKLLGNLGDVSPEEKRFVEGELRGPVDVAGLARQVPRGLEAQVYTMSVMAIDLDNRNEAAYLHELATAMGLRQADVNAIHARLGAPALYA